MLNSFKSPRWLTRIALLGIPLMFVGQILLNIILTNDPNLNSRLTGLSNMLNLGLNLIGLFLSVVLSRTDEFKVLMQTFGKDLRQHITQEGEKTRSEAQMQTKANIINRLSSQVNDVAKAAISELNANGWLSDGSLNGMDFGRARWQGADLKATNLAGAHIAAQLRRVKLQQANLERADMREIDLSGANLEAANLKGAWLQNANLSSADLTLTDLTGTKLTGATIEGANLAGATYDETTRLPDGKKCSPDEDWTKFGAVGE